MTKYLRVDMPFPIRQDIVPHNVTGIINCYDGKLYITVNFQDEKLRFNDKEYYLIDNHFTYKNGKTLPNLTKLNSSNIGEIYLKINKENNLENIITDAIKKALNEYLYPTEIIIDEWEIR